MSLHLGLNIERPLYVESNVLIIFTFLEITFILINIDDGPLLSYHVSSIVDNNILILIIKSCSNFYSFSSGVHNLSISV
jgi:hypothetical protein